MDISIGTKLKVVSSKNAEIKEGDVFPVAFFKFSDCKDFFKIWLPKSRRHLLVKSNGASIWSGCIAEKDRVEFVLA